MGRFVRDEVTVADYIAQFGQTLLEGLQASGREGRSTGSAAASA
ncbi:MAG: hypothetical protein WCF26_25075 [Candidatus Sulfotelmatobacter sp.]